MWIPHDTEHDTERGFVYLAHLGLVLVACLLVSWLFVSLSFGRSVACRLSLSEPNKAKGRANGKAKDRAEDRTIFLYAKRGASVCILAIGG